MAILCGRVVLVAAAALLGLVACNKRPAAEASRGGDGLSGVDCSAVNLPAEPDVTAWDATSRAQLDKLRRQGVVAVRYEAHGCDVSLELLPQCVGPKNRYVYSALSETDTKIARNARELFAQLPLGAATLSGFLDGRHAFRMDAKLVGAVGLPEGSTITEYDLVGPECKRATHVVGAIYVGGFAMATVDSRFVNTNNLITSVGPIEGVTREGSLPICERAEKERIELPGCSVPLRVALIPIDRQGAGAVSSPKKNPPIEKASSCTETDADAGCVRAEIASTERRVFDQNAVERVVREKQGAVKRKCWETTSDAVRRVNIAVTTTIDPEGRVLEAKAQLVDSEGSADVASAVARCVASEIRGWQFPEPDKPTVLTLPFHLIRQ
jgi:hypothetical protein